MYVYKFNMYARISAGRCIYRAFFSVNVGTTRPWTDIKYIFILQQETRGLHCSVYATTVSASINLGVKPSFDSFCFVTFDSTSRVLQYNDPDLRTRLTCLSNLSCEQPAIFVIINSSSSSSSSSSPQVDNKQPRNNALDKFRTAAVHTMQQRAFILRETLLYGLRYLTPPRRLCFTQRVSVCLSVSRIAQTSCD